LIRKAQLFLVLFIAAVPANIIIRLYSILPES